LGVGQVDRDVGVLLGRVVLDVVESESAHGVADLRCWCGPGTAPVRWCRSALAVRGEDLLRPGHEIFWALPRRLRGDPQFEVFWAVVIADAVLVMDVLAGTQLSAEHLLHHQAVLEYRLPAPADLDVALPVDAPAARTRGSPRAVAAAGA